jgi:phage gp29-like protein
MFKNYAIKDWVTFLESYGHPLRIGKYGPNESEDNKEILHRALYELGSDAAAAFPETMSVEFADRKAGTAPNDLWRSHAEYIDDQVSKAVLGQTNSTDAKSGGLGSRQADVHNELRRDLEEFDAMILAGSLNRDFVIPFVMFNHGPRSKYPRLKIGRPDEVDVKVEIESARELATMGVQIDGEEMRERAGLPAAKSEETALRVKSPQNGSEAAQGPDTPANPADIALRGLKTPPGGDRGDGRALNSQDQPAERDPDAIDLTIDEVLEDWEVQVDPLLAPIDALIGEVTDLSELQAQLARVIGSMDTATFEQALARSAFAARIAGQADRAPGGQDGGE